VPTASRHPEVTSHCPGILLQLQSTEDLDQMQQEFFLGNIGGTLKKFGHRFREKVTRRRWLGDWLVFMCLLWLSRCEGGLISF